MVHTDGLTWQARLGVLVAAVFVLLGGLAHPVRADVLVSDFCSLPNSGGEVRKFTDAGVPIPPVPFFTLGGDSLGAEGLACLNDTGVFRVFAANFGPVIHICELNTPGPCNQVFATSPHGSGSQYTALGLSIDGLLLYAADQTLGFIDAFNTSNGTLAFSLATQASHDIRVGPDGSVYATHVLHNTGVLKCTPNLSSCSQFIAPGDHGLLCPTGMAFDGAGNFWVANFGPTGSQPTCESAVYKYSSAGVFLQLVPDPPSHILLNPVGLEAGPGGGNIFAAAFGNNVCNPTLGSDIARINGTTGVVSTLIPFPDAGLNPKYLFFTQHCITRIPPPGPPPLVLRDNEPGSLLICPIFDVIGANQTKMRITCNGTTGTRVRVTYVCQPLGSSTTSAFCPSFDEAWDCTAHQTFVLDVGTQLFGSCPTGQGYVMAFAEDQCTAESPTYNPSTDTCATATGGALSHGEFGPISYNQLFGSCHLYFNGSVNPPGLLCGSVSCSPPLVPGTLFPDVEAINAIGIQSAHPAFSFLGNDTGGALQLSFGTTTAFDYVGLPRTVQTDFAAPGAPLIAGPTDFTPFIPPDTISGTELQTNIILLNLNYSQFAPNLPAAMSVNAWNWFETGFTSTHRFICWERIPINLIDPRLTFAGPFGAPYGNIKFTPSPLAGPSSPHLLGAIEEVATIGRTLRTMIHSSTAASPAIFITDIE